MYVKIVCIFYLFAGWMIPYTRGQEVVEAPKTHEKIGLKFMVFPYPYAMCATIGGEYRLGPAWGLHSSLTAWTLPDESESSGLIFGLEPRFYPWKNRHLGLGRKPHLGFQPYLGIPFGLLWDHETAFGIVDRIYLGIGPAAGLQWKFGRRWSVEFTLRFLLHIAQGSYYFEERDWGFGSFFPMPGPGLNFGFWW